MQPIPIATPNIRQIIIVISFFRCVIGVGIGLITAKIRIYMTWVIVVIVFALKTHISTIMITAGAPLTANPKSSPDLVLWFHIHKYCLEHHQKQFNTKYI